MGQKSELSVERRVELVLALLRKEEPAAQIARRAGVSEPTLYRWRDEFIKGARRSGRARAARRSRARSCPVCSARWSVGSR
jgi:transposase-like protein